MITSLSASPVVLFISTDKTAYAIGETLLEGGYDLFGCENLPQAKRFLLDNATDLVVINGRMVNAMAICEELRQASSTNMYPVIIIGPDTHNGSNCVAAFQAGADDFVQVPFPHEALLARLRHHMDSVKRLQAASSITAQASAAELAMILQFLETEQKTGRMIVKRQSIKGQMILLDGRLLKAEARGFSDVEAISEMLCWTSSTATFIEEKVEVQPGQTGTQLSDALTKAMAQVASYRAAKRRLPPPDTIFLSGMVAPDPTTDMVHRVTYEHALSGSTVDEILREDSVSPRLAAVALNDLLEEGCLETSTPLFVDYLLNLYRAYPDAGLQKQISILKAALEAVSFPLRQSGADSVEMRRKEKADREELPLAEANWRDDAPLILLGGNHKEYAATLLDSLSMVHESVTGKRAPQKRDLSGVEAHRYFFTATSPIEIVQLPAVMDRSSLRWLDQNRRRVVGAIVFSIDTTQKDSRNDLRLLRQLWSRFKGLYYLVVPKLPNRKQESFFHISCKICGHKLSVNIDHAGDQTACPACKEKTVIPDCMDCLARTLSLPDEVGVLQVQTNDPEHARDLVTLMLSEILASAENEEEPRAEWSNDTWTL